MLIKARLPNQTRSPYVLCGPRVDFLIQTRDLFPDINANRKTNVGITIGVGLELAELNVGVSDFGAEVRYDHDLTDAYYSARNNSFHFLVFVGF